MTSLLSWAWVILLLWQGLRLVSVPGYVVSALLLTYDLTGELLSATPSRLIGMLSYV